VIQSKPTRRSSAPVSVAGAILAPLCVLLWSGPGIAASACLKGVALNKLCLELTSVPGTSVQPSGLADTKTYVKYDVTIRNLVSATSRNVAATLTVAPTPSSALTFTANAGLACAVSGATVSCLGDKLDGVDPLTFTVTAEAPQYPATVTEMVATGVIGWNGNTAQTSQTVAVSNTAGESFIPKDTEVTLATNDSDDVTAENPRYGRITLPPQPFDYVATIAVVADAPANSNCISGIYFSTDGGPFICRDNETPGRAIRIDVGPAEFTAANPAVYTEKWDTTIVPATQLPPNAAAPTGTPPFATFTAPLSAQGSATAAYNALWLQCSTTVPVGPPCISSVQQLANGDWQAVGLRTNDGVTLVRSPLAPLQAVLDFLISRAEAQIVPKPDIGFMQ